MRGQHTSHMMFIPGFGKAVVKAECQAFKCGEVTVTSIGLNALTTQRDEAIAHAREMEHVVVEARPGLTTQAQTDLLIAHL